MNATTPGSEFEPPRTDKEVIVYKENWGFRLPTRHEIRLNETLSLASVLLPNRGGTYHVTKIEETDDEYRIHLGGWLAGHATGLGPTAATEYPFPSLNDELERLKRDIEAAGGDPMTVTAWAQGASYDSHTTAARADLRRLRRAATS